MPNRHKLIMDLTQCINRNKCFLFTTLLFFILAVYPLLACEPFDLFLKINSLNNPLLDKFFYYFTHLGSLQSYAMFIIILFLIKQDNKTILITISSFCLMSAIIQLMKRVIFCESLRPIEAIPAHIPLHFVKGVVNQTDMSFPSGHSGTVFTIMCLVCLLKPGKNFLFYLLLLSLASLVAYSRMYLCQHFYRDVYFGALIGVISTIATYFTLTLWQGPSYLNYSLWSKIFKN